MRIGQKLCCCSYVCASIGGMVLAHSTAVVVGWMKMSSVHYSVPVLHDLIRKPCIINYNTKLYPFREAIVDILNEDSSHGDDDDNNTTGGRNGGHILSRDSDLSSLHMMGDDEDDLYHIDKSGNRVARYQYRWNRNRDQLLHVTKRYQHFEEIYQSFIANIIGPSIGGGQILYQRAPTFRTYLPGLSVPMGKMHTDEEYHHQPSEINLWMPLSNRVFGNNSLYVESQPMLGDFHPLELTYGQCYRGYLNKCRHFTVPNDTNVTRVSMDFRVLNHITGGHDASFHRGVRRGSKALFQDRFDVGGFYSTMDIPEGPVLTIS